VHISAKVEYGLRALLALSEMGTMATTEALAEAQALPPRFLGSILNDLRRSGFVTNQRGTDGGYRLARPSDTITLADVMRALDGPLADVRGLRPEETRYHGAAVHLQDVWLALRASLESVLEHVTLDDVVQGRYPRSVTRLTKRPESVGARPLPNLV
jgi:Rrf2 family protein